MGSSQYELTTIYILQRGSRYSHAAYIGVRLRDSGRNPRSLDPSLTVALPAAAGGKVTGASRLSDQGGGVEGNQAACLIQEVGRALLSRRVYVAVYRWANSSK